VESDVAEVLAHSHDTRPFVVIRLPRLSAIGYASSVLEPAEDLDEDLGREPANAYVAVPSTLQLDEFLLQCRDLMF
jgi:hypothetical protein